MVASSGRVAMVHSKGTDSTSPSSVNLQWLRMATNGAHGGDVCLRFA